MTPGARRPRRAATAALAAAVLLAAPACSSGAAPGPRASAGATAAPALAQGQVERALSGVDAAVAAADAAGDAEGLAGRVDGAALELREAAYRVRAEVPTAPEPAPPSGDLLSAAVPPAGVQPPWFLAAVRPSADAVPQVLLLTRRGDGEPYRLSAQATLLAGASLPEPATRDGAAEPLAADAGGLVATPADALARYADVLTRGAGSPSAAATGDDAFARQVLDEQRSEHDGVASYVDYTASHAPRAGAVWALRARDGGAVVVGVLDGSRTFAPRVSGVRQQLPADLAALAGRADAPAGLVVRTTEVVVLRVPAAGSADPVSLVAASRGAVGVDVR